MNARSCKTSCQKGMNTIVPVATIEALHERIRCVEGGARHHQAVLPFGIKAIDERLPDGGLALGALHEVAGGGNGAIDGAAAALFAAGLAADRVIYIEAGDEKSVLACFEEALRYGKLGAVVAEVSHLSMTASRRLQ